MKHFFILCASLGLSLSLSAQQNNTFPTDYECLYEYKVTNSKSITDTYTTILQIGRDCSCFMDYTAFQSDSVNATSHASDEDIKKYQMQEMKNSLFFDQTVLQNHPQGEMSVYSVIPPDYYMYKEKLRPIQWNLSNETDTIWVTSAKRQRVNMEEGNGSYGTHRKYRPLTVPGNFAVFPAS